MKNILLVVFALLCGFTYGGLKGYSIGYDDAVETYTNLYNKIIKIQEETIEFIHANNIPFCEANAIKYLCRWRNKNGIEDLKKAKHYIDLLIELESRYEMRN